MVMPLRFEAVAALGSKPSETVLDVASGTGLSLPLLVEAVGPSGRVIAIEHSPEMMARARTRVREAGWGNVLLIESAAEEAPIPGGIDAALFHFTHDVLQSDRALRNLLAALRPGARLVLAGAKFTSWWLAPVNLWVLWRSRSYLTTFAGMEAPWQPISRYSADLAICSRLLDTAYLARGTLTHPPSQDRRAK